MNIINRQGLNCPMHISVLGEINVNWANKRQGLPSSRKARALLAYLAITGRAIRRERLCELFWDIPNDPRASLRWALWKLRLTIDTPDKQRLVADRERIALLLDDVEVDFTAARRRLSDNAEALSVFDLQALARNLSEPLLDGMDGVGDERFDAWLFGEREDARLMHVSVLGRIATHIDLDPMARVKWAYQWLDAMPCDSLAASTLVANCRAAGRTDEANSVEQRFRKVAAKGVIDLPRDFGSLKSAFMTAEEPKPKKSGRWKVQDQVIGFGRSVDDINVAYTTIGQGLPLVKASGGLSHLELDRESPIWGQNFRACAQERQLVCYDSRGCGLSDRNVHEISLDSCVCDLETVVDALGIERFPLIGQSQGSAVAIEYALRHPDRVSGLILISGFATGWRVGSPFESESIHDALLTLVRYAWETPNPAFRQMLSRNFMPDAQQEEMDWFNDLQQKSISPENAVRFFEAFGEFDIRKRLPLIEIPTIVFHSKNDQCVGINKGSSLARGIPNAQFVPLESRHHLLLNTEPAWEACRERISAFLHRH